jgi:hypothetical protein
MGEEFEEEQECGVVIDHDVEELYEDDDVWQGVCRRCGAELFEDKKEGSDGPQ